MFGGLWGGYGFLARISPWMIWRNYLDWMRLFIQVPFLGFYAPSRLPVFGAWFGMLSAAEGRPIRPETMFTPEAWGRTVEVGRIIASQIIADMISVTEDPQRRAELERLRDEILGAPARYGPPIPPTVPTVPLPRPAPITYPTPTPPPTVAVPIRAIPQPPSSPLSFEPSGPVEVPVRLTLNADIIDRDGTVLDTITRELSTVVVLQPKVVRTLG